MKRTFIWLLVILAVAGIAYWLVQYKKKLAAEKAGTATTTSTTAGREAPNPAPPGMPLATSQERTSAGYPEA